MPALVILLVGVVAALYGVAYVGKLILPENLQWAILGGVFALLGKSAWDKHYGSGSDRRGD